MINGYESPSIDRVGAGTGEEKPDGLGVGFYLIAGLVAVFVAAVYTNFYLVAVDWKYWTERG